MRQFPTHILLVGLSGGIFAGNRMHEMNMQQTQIVKDCVYEAIRNSQDS